MTTENKPAFGIAPYAPAFPVEEVAQSSRLICQHCGRDYKDKSSLRVHNFKKHRHLNAAPTSTNGSTAAAALVATSAQMAQDDSDGYQEQERLQLYHHQLRLQQLQARAATADLDQGPHALQRVRPRDFQHDDDFYGHHDNADLVDPAAAAAFASRMRQPAAFLPQESHKRGAAQHSNFAPLAPSPPAAAHMSIDVTTRLLPVLNPAVDETGKRRRVGERFTPTPIGSITKRSKAAFLPVSPHATSASSTADTATTQHAAAAPSAAEHFELDASELAKNLSMLNDLADVALATSRNAQ